MRKLIVIVGAVLFFVPLGGAAAGGISQSTPRTSAQLDNESYTGAPIECVDSQALAGGSATPIPMGEMSQAEKERRREACANEYTACYDQCNRFYANKRGWKKLGPCEADCSTKNTECMKKIP